MNKIVKLTIFICCVLTAESHNENKYAKKDVIPLASLLSHPEPQKKDLCNNYNLELTEPKPHRTTCNIECDLKSAVKCSLLEYNVPECKDFAGYIFKKIFQNFTIVEQQKEFKCEIPTKDRHKPIVRSQDGKGDMKKSPLCDAYKKVTVKSAFEFPCFLKCQTAMIGVSTDLSKVDWELDCEIYQQTCQPSHSTKPIDFGTICESYRQFVLSKVKMGENNSHHCDVYNHGPQFDYFNYTKA